MSVFSLVSVFISENGAASRCARLCDNSDGRQFPNVFRIPAVISRGFGCFGYFRYFWFI
jgi:hypothetical protein